MKKVIIALSVVLTFSVTLGLSSWRADAHMKEGVVTIEEVLALIDGIPKIIGYRDTLKPGIENQVRVYGNDPNVSVKDRQDLKLGYDATADKFNIWVDMIKTDMLSADSLAKMKSSPEASTQFAKKYLFAYLAAIDTYEKQFKPVTTRIQVNNKPIDPQIITLGLQATIAIVDCIKQWNEQKKLDKEAALSLLNITINTLFANKLHMQPWSQLVTLNLPVATRTGALSPIDLGQTPPAGSAPIPVPLTTETKIGPDQLRVQPAVLSCPLSGSFYLLQYSATGTTPIPLTLGASKMTVEYDDTQTGNVVPIDVTTTSFSANLKAGDQFRLHVNTGCYAYVFALNQDGTCEPIYPFNNLNGSVPDPLMSRDALNNFVVPYQDPASLKGASMTICRTCSQENLAIIFSRTEFDLNDMMFKVSRLPGTLEQRLGALFTTQALNPTDGILSIQMTDKVHFVTKQPPSNAVVAYTIRFAVTPK